MPYSSAAGKDWIRERLPLAEETRRVLDVGVGAGQYADLFRSALPRAEWVGIEVWAPYIERFELERKYDRIVIGDARWLDFAKLGGFDVCFCGDILEHMPLADAQALADNLLNRTKLLFMSVPLGHCPQDAVGGNPFERHVTDDFTDESVRQTFPALIDGGVETVDQWTVGAYALTRDPQVAARLAAMKLAR